MAFDLLLSDFLSGYWFTRGSQLLYPHLTRIRTPYNDQGLNILMDKFDFDAPTTNVGFAKMLVSTYRWLEENSPKEQDSKVVSLQGWTYEEFDSATRGLIDYSTMTKLQPYTRFAGVHGSYATQDYEIGISDIDFIICCNAKGFRSYEDLLIVQELVFDLRKESYRFDILQHHGPFILTEVHLKSYLQSFFPVRLFELSRFCVRYESKIRLNLIKQESRNKEILDQTLTYLTNTKTEDLKFYDFKVFFQVIQLLPVAYWQFKHGYIDKKSSFTAFSTEFPPFLDFYQDIYLLRLVWRQPKSWKICFYLQHLVIKKFLPTPKYLHKHLSEILVKHNFSKLLLDVQEKTK